MCPPGRSTGLSVACAVIYLANAVAPAYPHFLFFQLLSLTKASETSVRYVVWSNLRDFCTIKLSEQLAQVFHNELVRFGLFRILAG